jgi:hypothetical protein
MARKKQEFEDRKAKTLGPGMPSSEGPSEAPKPTAAAAATAAVEAVPAAKPAAATKAEAKPAAAAASKKAAAPDLMEGPMVEPETEMDKDMKGALGKGAAAAPAPGGGKAGLDGDFLDGLLDDPTGGKKK